MDSARFASVIGTVLAGMILWAIAFTAAYLVVAVVCARRLGDVDVLGLPILPFSIGAITIVTLAATGLVAFGAYRRRPGSGEDSDLPAFVRSVALFVALMALLGIVWNGVPALFFASCA
jgi:uncharacterized membrane protein